MLSATNPHQPLSRKYIKCGCRTTYKCHTCSCKKNNLSCIVLCKCHNSDCSNLSDYKMMEDENDIIRGECAADSV